jgi:hypothetical protein
VTGERLGGWECAVETGHAGLQSAIDGGRGLV